MGRCNTMTWDHEQLDQIVQFFELYQTSLVPPTLRISSSDLFSPRASWCSKTEQFSLSVAITSDYHRRREMQSVKNWWMRKWRAPKFGLSGHFFIATHRSFRDRAHCTCAACISGIVGIIEDYDRMIRIILLTTISCTHLDIVHSSQYV